MQPARRRTVFLASLTLFAAALLALPWIPHPARACPISYTPEQISEDLSEVEEKLALLWSGSREDRLWVARDPFPHFRPFWEDFAEEDRPRAVEVVWARQLEGR